MIYSPPTQPIEIRYRPSYHNVASEAIFQQYQKTEQQMIVSRSESEYITNKFAQLEAVRRLKQLAVMKPNWNSYGAESPTRNAIDAATAIINESIDIGLLPDAILASAE